MPEASALNQAIEDRKEPIVEAHLLYDEEQKTHLEALQLRLETARTMRDQPHDEFDGMTYLERVEANRKGANTYIPPKENKQDTTLVTGTTRQKLLTFLAAVNNLDLVGDVQAFDEDNIEIADLGEDIEDIAQKSRKLDNDDEKRLLRQYVGFEQGEVFVEQNWEVRLQNQKKFAWSMRDFTGDATGKTWEDNLRKVFEGATRKVVKHENMYLGDITKVFINEQPYIFTAETVHYSIAEKMFNKFPNWKNVPRKIVRNADETPTIYGGNWTLNEVEDEFVEIIRYQDKWNDEFQILCNGVLMLPPGFPMPWRYGEYNVTCQIIEIISDHFAYGKSFVSRMRTSQALVDESMRLALLKFQKSALPPQYNNTGIRFTSRVLMPGMITMGLDPNKFGEIGTNEGVNNGEMAMIQMLYKNLDDSSVNATFQGQQATAGTTATEVANLQKQAEQLLGITVFVCALLEEKLDYLLLYTLLENYFNPVDTRVDAARGVLIEKYRNFSVSSGGARKIIRVAPSNRIPSPEDIKAEEEQHSVSGRVTRIHYIDPDIVRSARYEWFITVTPQPKKTSQFAKATFDQYFQRLMAFPNPDITEAEKDFARVWEKDPSKIFKPMEQQPGMPTDQQDPNATPAATPSRVNTPSPMSQVMKQ